jgi:hypothetical protein
LLPTEQDLTASENHAEVIGAVETGVFKELTTGLMASFHEMQTANDELLLKDAVKRANTKISLSKAITDIAKTAISGKKAMNKNR